MLRMYGRFIIVLLVVLIVMGVAHTKITPIGETARKAENEAMADMRGLVTAVGQDVKRDNQPANVTIGERRARQSLLETLARGAAESLNYQVLPEFRMPAELAGKDAERNTYYQQTLRRVTNRVGFARFWGPKRLTSAGSAATEVGFDFGDITGPGAGPLEEKMDKLDILSRVANAAGSAGVFRVTRFSFRDPQWDRVRARLPSVDGGPVAGAAPNTVGRPMLRRVEMELEVTATPQAALKLLTDLQTPVGNGVQGRALHLEEFTLSKEDWRDSGDDLVRLTAVLSATRVRIDASLPEESVRRAIARADARALARQQAATSGTPTPGTTDEPDDDFGAPPPGSGTRPGPRRAGSGR
jgi:Sec-independent protein translocase protein TatA